MYAPMRMRSLAALALWPVNGRGLLFAPLHLPRPGSSNPGMALYVGVACSRRRDLFKLCPHRRFTFTSGQSPITPTYDFCYKRRAIIPDRRPNPYVATRGKID